MTRYVTAHEFNEHFAFKVKSERKITNEILCDILSAEDKRVHLELGYSSLFDWLTNGHGYSEGAAQRRIQAARLMSLVPEISEKLIDGKTNLTNVAKAQSVFRMQEKMGPKLSPTQKMEVIEKLESKSSQDAEKTLSQMFPEVAAQMQIERKVMIDDQAAELLERVRELLSHKLPEASLSDVAAYLAEEYIKKNDPLVRKVRTKENQIQDEAKQSHTQDRQGQMNPIKSPTAVAAKRCVTKPHDIKISAKDRPSAKSTHDHAKNTKAIPRPSQGQFEESRSKKPTDDVNIKTPPLERFVTVPLG